MPQKRNRNGMQEYVPAGNGDASGEYSDGDGNNKHFSTFKKPTQNGGDVVNVGGKETDLKQDEGQTQEATQEEKKKTKTIEERKQSLKDTITKRFKGENETGVKMIDNLLNESDDEGLIFLDNYLEQNSKITFTEGGAGKGNAGCFYPNGAIHIVGGYAKVDSHTLTHELGHSIDNYIYDVLCGDEKNTIMEDFATSCWKDEDGKTFADALDEECGVGGREMKLSGYRVSVVAKHKINKESAVRLGRAFRDAYDGYGDSIVKSDLGIDNYSKMKRDYDSIERNQSVELKEIMKKDREFIQADYFYNLTKDEVYKAENKYAEEERAKGNHSIVFGNSPDVARARALLDVARQKYYDVEDRVKKVAGAELLQQKGYSPEQSKLFMENSLLPIKTSIKIQKGIGGIGGDLNDCGVSVNSVYALNGHGKSYFTKAGNPLSEELFANMYETYRRKDKTAYEAIKKVMPKTIQKFENMMNAVKEKVNGKV